VWSSRLFWKLFGTFAAVSVLATFVFATAVVNWQEEQITRLLEGQLHDTAIIVAHEVSARLADESQSAGLQGFIQNLASRTHTRLTVTALDGRVLADSDHDPSAMDNHKNRPEMVQAAAGSVGISQRVSPTLGVPMLYVAVTAEHDGQPIALIRGALPLDQLNRRAAELRWSVIKASALVNLIALLIVYAVVRRIVQPVAALKDAARAIASGELVARIPVTGRDEFGTLADAIRTMNAELARRLNQLRSNAQQLRTVLGSMTEGVVAIDARRRVLFANQAARQLLAITDPEVEGKPLWNLSRYPRLEQAVAEALAGHTGTRYELELDGKPPRALTFNVTEIPHDSGMGIVLVLHDVTDLRRLERLRQEFVANVSHELKTPLASIKAYAETLADGALADPQHNVVFVERIAEQAERLDSLIQDLLSLARIEAGQNTPEPVDMDLNHVLPDWAGDHLPAADAKQISLTWVIIPTPVLVSVDPESLRQILDNLLANAIKYTPPGGRVQVRWRSQGDQAVIEVEDTGIGIARVEQERIFERFYRVDKARSRELGGTGLGLSIVKHLTQSLGGQVSVRSQLGSGSIFVLLLPLLPAGGRASFSSTTAPHKD
jgi:two-component system phosphate regulon sensor histidine kinase PhoR